MNGAQGSTSPSFPEVLDMGKCCFVDIKKFIIVGIQNPLNYMSLGKTFCFVRKNIDKQTIDTLTGNKTCKLFNKVLLFGIIYLRKTVTK